MTMNKDTLYVKRKRPTDMLLLAAIYISVVNSMRETSLPGLAYSFR